MIGTIYGCHHGVRRCVKDLAQYMSQMFSDTLEDAEADATLCKVGDEYFNGQQATLNGSGLYTLSDLLRGRFDDAQAHIANEPFIGIDNAIFSHRFNQNLVVFQKIC